MKHPLAILAFVTLSGLVLAACGSVPAKPATEAPAKPALSEAAQQALDKAAVDVKAAQARFALWTTAEAAYKSALEAAKAGDSEAVLKQAKFASDQAALGLGQLDYPTTELK